MIAVLLLVAAVLTGLLGEPPEASVASGFSPSPRTADPAKGHPERDPAPTYDSDPARPLAPARRNPTDRTSRSDLVREPVTSEPVTSGLDVTMESLSPSQLQPGSPVQVTGTITDVEDEEWTNLKVYLVVDEMPATTPDELDTVLASEADAVTGERITASGSFAELGDLGAGGSVGYSLDVPSRLLGLDDASPGVYTVGVHVLTDRTDGGRLTAGRARTLMPLVLPGTEAPPVGLTVMLPLRTPLVREPDGTYPDLDGVLEQVGPGGRMRNLLDLAATTESGDTSLLLDPALIDLLLAVVADEFDSPLRSPPSERQGPDTDETDTDETAEEDGAEETDLQTPVDGVVSSAQRRSAADFLDDLRGVAETVDLLAEPYGAADLTAVRSFGSRYLQRSVARAGAVALERAGLDAEPVLLPVGDLHSDQLARLAGRRTVVLGSEQLQGWDVTDGPGTWLGDTPSDAATRRRGEASVVVVDETLADGGPEPGVTDGPVQIRQRLLSETAVLSLTAGAAGRTSAPGLVHLAGASWDPGVGQSGSGLFDALDTPWISPASLTAQLPVEGEATRARPATDLAPGVAEYVVDAARGIRSRATIVQSLVGREVDLLRWYDRTAALTVSSHQRDDGLAAQQRAGEVADDLNRALARVGVEGPEFVTLSSDSGTFPITLTNELPRPITVGVSLRDSAGALRFGDVPLETIDAGGSAQLALEVGAPDLGVTEVTATLVTANGRTFGTAETFNLRSSVVGAYIWVAFAAGGVFLVLLVVRRLGRRIVASRRGQVPS